MSIDGSQRQPRDGGKKKSPGDAQKPRERIFLSGKFEIPDRGRNYGDEEGRGEEGEGNTRMLLYRTRFQHHPPVSLALDLIA